MGYYEAAQHIPATVRTDVNSYVREAARAADFDVVPQVRWWRQASGSGRLLNVAAGAVMWVHEGDTDVINVDVQRAARCPPRVLRWIVFHETRHLDMNRLGLTGSFRELDEEDADEWATEQTGVNQRWGTKRNYE